MDVYGKSPVSPKGEFFRRSVWGWHPLWEYCEETAPEITYKVVYGHSNDGDGLGAEDSIELSRHLREEIAYGRTARYVRERDDRLAALPDEPCRICDGTGRRLPPPEVGPGELPCNGCNSRGKVRPSETHYGLDVEDVREFAEFLNDCGGFEIC
jgi:hypothetical protein